MVENAKMPIFKVNKTRLEQISEKKIDLERDIQKLTEQNLEMIFGLRFVAGVSNQEFSVRVNEQDFYIDTVAFDESSNAIVLIEYKKDRSFSVIDQGFAYLSAMLNNKAEFILELNERLQKKFSKNDIDWEQSRIIFISNEFTNYQRNAINFKDLPMYLYEVKVYDGLVDYNPIKPFRTSETIKRFIKDKKIQNISREVKVKTADDLIRPEWTNTRELYETLRSQIMKLGKNKENITKLYFSYMLFSRGQWLCFTEIVPQANGLMVHLDASIDDISDPKNILIDCKDKGRWASGPTKFSISDGLDIPYAMSLISQAYDLRNL